VRRWQPGCEGKASVRPDLKLLAVLLAAWLLAAGCGGKKNKALVGDSAEPDKVLYESALEDIRRGRHEVARLSLQTLLNTYPDSEYVAKAKLATADSYFKQGGTSGLTQAIAEYKDFLTFFPFLEEAAYAQMQVGKAHFKRMEKPDRDRSAARMAEEEFQIFLQKYPDSALAPEAKQRLREVQEVLAEGDFRIARFYYIKGSMRASAARLQEIVNRYPLYSQADTALWLLGNAYEKAEKGDIASQYYSRIVRDYPLSDLLPDAKERLTGLGVPVPQPDPVALARMQKQRELGQDRQGIIARAKGMFSIRPDVSMAAKAGEPQMAPPSEAATQTISGGETSTVGGSGGASPGSTTAVEVVPAGPTSGTSAGSAPRTDENSREAKPADVQPKPDTEALPAKKSDEKKKDEKKKEEKESSSKKKKGLRKIIPW